MMSRFEIIPLFSGSSGNSTLVVAGGKNILIDAGRNCKQICTALSGTDIKPEDIDYVFVTHSHHDHTDAIDVFRRKYKVPVYGTANTLYYISRKSAKPHPDSDDIEIEEGETVLLANDLAVKAISTPHDAPGSVCYKIVSGDRSVMIMTDLGYVTDEIIADAYGCDVILIEANYDQMMLVYGGYPEELKSRIAGRWGHLSNDACARAVFDLYEHGTRKFILGHLSANNNTREAAFETVTGFMKDEGLVEGRDYFIKVANRYDPTEGTVVS